MVDEEGLFIVIKQLNHNLEYRGEDFSSKPKLNYNADEDRIIELFGHHDKPWTRATNVFTRNYMYLKGLLYPPKKIKPPNMLIGTNLTNGNGPNSFYSFMQRVADYKKEHKQPTFIMFFLMSHGFDDGQILLSTTSFRTRQGATTVGSCCDPRYPEEHSLSGDCYGRHIVEDVIKKVCKDYPDIPKVFIIQTCRGGQNSIVKEGEADPNTGQQENSDIELFIPDCSDTLVFRACIEGHTALVQDEGDDRDMPKGGSLLIQNFCKSLEDLKVTEEEFNKLMKKTKHKKKDATSELITLRENITGEWIMNVCQRTTALVTNWLFINVILPDLPLFDQVLVLAYTIDDISAKDKNFREKLHENFVANLKNPDTQHQTALDSIIKACKDYKSSNWWPILQYMSFNLSEATPKHPLNVPQMKKHEKNILQENLDKIIEEMQLLEPYAKQQPHITSTLCKHLSCLEIMKTQERKTTD